MSGGRKPLAWTTRALEHLRTHGLLLLQDREAASLAAMIAGEPVAGSWWGHPRGNEIFLVANALDDHPEVITAKLVGSKVTFVHRDLWPALNAVARGGGDWQSGLSREALVIGERIAAGERVRAGGAAARELESRLLCGSRQVHTDGGKHVLELVPWSLLIGAEFLADLAAARAALESAAAAIGAPDRLPWI
jgi:hypothetical protein